MLRNITLSADKSLIEQARHLAEAENTTLNAEFRRWLAQYVQQAQATSNLTALMQKFDYAQPGKTFTRDEMNER